jgi:zinc transporter ZupT
VNDYFNVRRAGCPGYEDGRRLLRNLEVNSSSTNTASTDEILTSDSEKCSKALFPLPYLLFFVGYLIILTVDRVIIKHSHGGMLDDHHGHDHSKEEKKQNGKQL